MDSRRPKPSISFAPAPGSPHSSSDEFHFKRKDDEARPSRPRPPPAVTVRPYGHPSSAPQPTAHRFDKRQKAAAVLPPPTTPPPALWRQQGGGGPGEDAFFPYINNHQQRPFTMFASPTERSVVTVTRYEKLYQESSYS